MTLSITTDDTLLHRVTAGGSLLDSLHAGAELRSRVAAGLGEPDRLVEAFGAGDELTRILLMAAFAELPGPEADALLLTALSDPSPAQREHAAWALGARAP